MNLILPKKQKINDVEEIAIPMVKCTFCGNMTSAGMKQTRLDMVEKGSTRIENGRKMYKPPRMKRKDFYMCTNCVKKDKKWPGQRP